MDILQQRRRIIITAIATVVLTGIIIAVVATVPLIDHVHSLTSQLAGNVADTKAENIRSILGKHQGLANQTASRTELARMLQQFADGELQANELQSFSRPRLRDAARSIDNLAAIVRYDFEGNEVVRVGPMAKALPDNIPLPGEMDIKQYMLTSDQTSAPLLHAVSTIRGSDDQVVGHDLLVFFLSPLERVFKSLDNSTLCLVDTARTRRVALNPDSGELEMSSPSCLEPGTNLEGLEESGYLRTTTDEGTRVLMFLRPLEGYNWQVNIRSEVSHVYSAVVEDAVFTAVIILMLSGLSGLVVLRALSPLLHTLIDQSAQIVRSSEELRLAYRAFEYTHEVIAISDAAFNIVRANPAFTEITGTPQRNLTGKNLMEFLDDRTGRVPSLEDLRQQLDSQSAWHGEAWLKGTGDKPLPYLLTVSPVRNRQGELQNFVLTFTNITERVKAERHMHRLAHYDKLTGLPNRMALENHLDKSLQQARASQGIFAMMFLDLDRFKPVNDTHGHQVGDELLINVAKRLSHSLRSDDIVGRQGGDEFVIITGPLASTGDSRAIAEKMIATLNEPFEIRGLHLQIGASVGVALYPDDGQSAEELLKKADIAMYKVKSGGRNNVAFA